MGVPKQPVAAASRLRPAPISPSCICRSKSRIRLPFWGQTAAEFAHLQPPVRDACREVDVFPKRMRRHASAEASCLHSVAAPLFARVGGDCSCRCRLRARHRAAAAAAAAAAASSSTPSLHCTRLQSCPCALLLCLNLKCSMKSNPAVICTRSH